jgi:hypothetical protein
LRGKAPTSTDDGDRFCDRLRLAQAERVLHHEPRRCRFAIGSALLDPRAVAGVEEDRDFLHDFVRQRFREIPQIVRVELAQHPDEIRLGRVLDERLSDAGADFDERLRGGTRRQLTPDDRTIVERQRLQNVGHVSRVQSLQTLVQLDEVLSVLHLLEQRTLWCLLTPRDGLEQPVFRQQAMNFGEAFL